MNAARRRWLLFALSSAAVVGVLAWVSAVALDGEARRDETRVLIDRENRMSLALWRVDTTVTALVAGESARPAAHYRSFYAEEHAFGAGLERRGAADTLVPSPLIDARTDLNARYVELHAEARPDGSWSSPQVPTGAVLAKALEHGLVLREEVERRAGRLEQLSAALTYRELTTAIERGAARGAGTKDEPASALVSDEWRRSQQLALQEYQLRAQNLRAANPPERGAPSVDERGPFQPYLFQNKERRSFELVFLRRAVAPDGPSIQCVWINWRILRRQLLDSVNADLFPGAFVDLVPEDAKFEDADFSGRLASLPSKLVVRGDAAPVASSWSATHVALLAGWLAVLAALVAVGLVLRTALDLGERRGRFVAAVTHELRTPLTTFCLYSEMLANDMVANEDDRRTYLATLQRESTRLRRIVDNVLLYARVEGAASRRGRERVSVAELLERTRPTLERRASEGGLELHLATADLPSGLEVVASPEMVEQILLNLIDNACKYAAHDDPRAEVSARIERNRVHVRVRDHGPGIADEEARAIFAAFGRSAGARTSAVAGLGLGLALARGFARELGGDLVLVPVEGGGAAFELVLPLARAGAS